MFAILGRFRKRCKKSRKYFSIWRYLQLNWLLSTLAFTEREYFSPAVSMLANRLKISDITKTDFFELIFFQSHQKTWQNYWRTDLSTVLEALTSWLYTSVLTRGFLGFYITSHFAFYNLRNKSLLRLIFSWKYSKFYLDFGNGEKNLENYLSFGDNCVWIGCFKHALLLRENTCHRVLIC